MVYVTTVAYFGARLAGAPPVDRTGMEVEVLQGNDVKELQELLNKQGYDVGEPDGKVGVKTRSAVKQAQMKAGLPAEFLPDHGIDRPPARRGERAALASEKRRRT